MTHPSLPIRILSLIVPVALATGCSAKDDRAGDDDPAGGGLTNVNADGDDGDESSSGGVGTTDGGGEADDDDDDDDAADADGDDDDDEPVDPPVNFDLGTIPDAGDVNVCGAPSPVSCDEDDDDPWHALGLNCPGGPEVTGSYMGDPQAIYVHTGNLGTHMPPPFPPQEGEKFVILSSGIAQEMTVGGLYASTANPGNDPVNNLPAPIVTNSVSATEDCADNPGLVGTGDCSNTIETQWSQGNGAYDWAEMRLTVEVPAGTYGFSYNLAMFSTEYPVYYQSQFNDMYIAWLESEQWTGNVSFDEMGNPISLNAGFLDYKDAPNSYDCPAPCAAPELAGTAMQGHAGTKWLTTTAGVTPGETIEVVFAVFDLSDNILDTVVLLDNWLWECEGGPPVTIPG